MKFVTPLIVVKDLKESRKFYEDILGLKVEMDFGANIVFEGGFALQTQESWLSFIDKKNEDIKYNSNNAELYFEEDDFDSFIIKLEGIKDLNYVHKTIEHRWGQRVVRFYDLDMHIIEVGENMCSVAKRFLDSGMTVEQVTLRMDVTIDYVNELIR